MAFDPEFADRLAFTRKRSGHLLSKHRYLSAQFYALLEGGLWLDLARHANDMAALLSEGLDGIEGARLAHSTQANMVFAVLPADAHDRARAAGATYFKWSSLDEADQDEVTVRFVCGRNTTEAEVEALLAALRG